MSIIKDHNKEFSYMEMEVLKEYSDSINATRTHFTVNGCENLTIENEITVVCLWISTIKQDRKILVSKRHLDNFSGCSVMGAVDLKKFLIDR